MMSMMFENPLCPVCHHEMPDLVGKRMPVNTDFVRQTATVIACPHCRSAITALLDSPPQKPSATAMDLLRSYF